MVRRLKADARNIHSAVTAAIREEPMIDWKSSDALRSLSSGRISLSTTDPGRAIPVFVIGVDSKIETESMFAVWRYIMCQQPTVHNDNRIVFADPSDHCIVQ